MIGKLSILENFITNDFIIFKIKENKIEINQNPIQHTVTGKLNRELIDIEKLKKLSKSELDNEIIQIELMTDFIRNTTTICNVKYSNIDIHSFKRISNPHE